MGLVLNKGMPSYIQMSGSKADSGDDPQKTRDLSAMRPRRRLHLTFVCQRTSCYPRVRSQKAVTRRGSAVKLFHQGEGEQHR